jgi:hypothetical protein
MLHTESTWLGRGLGMGLTPPIGIAPIIGCGGGAPYIGGTIGAMPIPMPPIANGLLQAIVPCSVVINSNPTNKPLQARLSKYALSGASVLLPRVLSL